MALFDEKSLADGNRIESSCLLAGALIVSERMLRPDLKLRLSIAVLMIRFIYYNKKRISPSI